VPLASRHAGTLVSSRILGRRKIIPQDHGLSGSMGSESDPRRIAASYLPGGGVESHEPPFSTSHCARDAFHSDSRGFDLRRVSKRDGDGYLILMTPKKKARQGVKVKIRDIMRRGGATPAGILGKRINATLARMGQLFQGRQCQSCLQ